MRMHCAVGDLPEFHFFYAARHSQHRMSLLKWLIQAVRQKRFGRRYPPLAGRRLGIGVRRHGVWGYRVSPIAWQTAMTAAAHQFATGA
jgi:hypothetical protein